jgi:hypothetical protein
MYANVLQSLEPMLFSLAAQVQPASSRDIASTRCFFRKQR